MILSKIDEDSSGSVESKSMYEEKITRDVLQDANIDIRLPLVNDESSVREDSVSFTCLGYASPLSCITECLLKQLPGAGDNCIGS